jgi:hippurate hydrolase
MYEQLLTGARTLQSQTVAMRRDIHREPELGLDLPRTRAIVLDGLSGLDLEINQSQATTGFVAILRGARSGPNVLLRGDMDGLPMFEDTGLPYASQTPGRMHACGHDAHTAMLASAAHLLSEHVEHISGNVLFMFQPGEEGYGGAKIMLDEGVLEAGGKPDSVFALHVAPELPSGVVGCRSGPILAATDTVHGRIIGRGGHGSMPHNAADPIPVACEVVQAIQTLVTRRFSVFEPVVATVGRIQAGTTNNVIPESAELDITLRSLSEDTRERLASGVCDLIEQIAVAHGLQGEAKFKRGYPPTINHAAGSGLVAAAAKALLGEKGYRLMPEPFMAAEDFSYLLQRYNGAFAFLGVAPPGTEGTAAPCHSNHMLIDEDAMAVGVAMHAAIVLTSFDGSV